MSTGDHRTLSAQSPNRMMNRAVGAHHSVADPLERQVADDTESCPCSPCSTAVADAWRESTPETRPR